MIVLFLHSFLCYNDNSDRSQIRKTLLCLFIILNKPEFYILILSEFVFAFLHLCTYVSLMFALGILRKAVLKISLESLYGHVHCEKKNAENSQDCFSSEHTQTHTRPS